MQHVLVHVFINAFDSMAGLPEGTPRRLDIVLTDIPEQERVRLSIQDSGPGFPEEILATAFEPFVTARNIPDHNGLGLHFCRTLLSTMGGTISASNGTRGAVICIELPAARLPP
jgi:two-component system C4-dicarboxylate transport sensor histidine kinase DctB